MRDLARADAPPPPTAPDQDHAELEVDGARWRAWVLGRSGGGHGAAVPMLLLGFRRIEAAPAEPSEDDADGRPALEGAVAEREALVVGRTLAGLTPLELENALRSSREPASSPSSANDDRIGGRDRRGGATRRPGR